MPAVMALGSRSLLRSDIPPFRHSSRQPTSQGGTLQQMKNPTDARLPHGVILKSSRSTTLMLCSFNFCSGMGPRDKYNGSTRNVRDVANLNRTQCCSSVYNRTLCYNGVYRRSVCCNGVYNSTVCFSGVYNSAPSSDPRSRTPRDVPVTFGSWYRDALADKRPPPLLGSLKPRQLQWMIRNLEDSEWAELASQVLQDPVYQDRVEWTQYESLLEKEGAEAAVAYAMSKKWVNRVDHAWEGVNPDYIGTSFSERIPRIGQEQERAKRIDLMLASAAQAARTQRPNSKRDIPRRRPKLVVSSEEQLQRRRERRTRQTERRDSESADSSSPGVAGGGGGDGRGLADSAPALASGVQPTTGPQGKTGTDWLPSTNSRDWLIQLVEKQEKEMEERKSQRQS